MLRSRSSAVHRLETTARSSTTCQRLDPQAEQIVNSVQGSAGQATCGTEKNPAFAPTVEDAKAAYTDSAKLTALVAAIFVLLFVPWHPFGLPSRFSRR